MMRREWRGRILGVVLCCLMCGLVLFAQAPALQSRASLAGSASAEQLMGTALHQEEVEGDLRAAIDTYQKVLNAPNLPRAIAARAQFRLGACFERLGLSEAQKAYSAVVRDYADQADVVAQAQTRLARLQAAAQAKPQAGQSLRQIWTDINDAGQISPDGRFMAAVDEDTANLLLRPLDGTPSVPLTNILKDRAWDDYVDELAWSRDSRSIAYSLARGSERDGKWVETYELWVGDAMKAVSRKVPLSETYAFIEPGGWSRDGSRVLALMETASGIAINWVSVVDGSATVMVNLTQRGFKGVVSVPRVSKDDKWVLFTTKTDVEFERQWMVVPAIGGEPKKLLVTTTSADLIGWTPDGKALIVQPSTPRPQLELLPFEDGKLVGSATVLPQREGFQAMGVTDAGSVLYRVRSDFRYDVYTATIDPATLELVGEPQLLSDRGVNSHTAAAWSPDGKSIAWVTSRGVTQPSILSVFQVDGSLRRSFSTQSTLAQFHNLTWTADSRFIIAKGNDRKGIGLHKIDSLSGASVDLVPIDPVKFPMPMYQFNPAITLATWAPDGKAVYVTVDRNDKTNPRWTESVIERRLDNGFERTVWRGEPGLWLPSVAASPDGKWLAAKLSRRENGKTRWFIVLVDLASGAHRQLAEQDLEGYSLNLMSWVPDSSAIVYTLIGPPKPPQVRRLSIDGRHQTRIDLKFDYITEVVMAPEGRRIAFAAMNKIKPDGIWLLERFLPESKAAAPAVRKQDAK